MKKALYVIIVMVFTLTACSLPGVEILESLSPSATAETPAETETSVTESIATAEPVLATTTVVPTVEETVATASPVETESAEDQAVLLFTIGMHVEPFGETAQGFPGSGKNIGDYNDIPFFNLHTQYIRTVADMVADHGGVMTVQVQSPFTETVILTNDPILRDLVDMGFEIALHFHEDAHLGKHSTDLKPAKWCEVMKQEINLIKVASGVDQVNYWSGGNLYPEVHQAADCAGLRINSDWKSPQTQSTDSSLLGIQPWRPSGGTDGSDFALISTHDPEGPIVFLPEGLFDRKDINAIKKSEAAGGDEAYMAYLEQMLLASVEAARTDRVNVFHFTIHTAELRGDPQHPFALLEKFLTEVVDPLVASGKLQWATYSQMEEAFEEWEAANPGVDPRS